MTDAAKKVSSLGSAAQLEFRPFNRELELPLQRELFRDAFPEAVDTPQEKNNHYLWKFQGFPDVPPSYEYGAYCDGKMVGYYAAIPYRYNLHGQEIKSAMVCDVMTHSSMRGKGIFTKLGAYALEQMTKAGLDISFGYPIRPEVIPGHLKVGWKLSGKLPLQLKVHKVDAALKNHSLRILSPILNCCCVIYSLIFKSKRKRNLTVKLQTLSEFLSDSNLTEFISKNSLSKANILQKDLQFLRWRYGAPDVKYNVVSVIENSKIVAASFVRKVILKDIPTLAILDLIVTEGKESSLGTLFSGIQELANQVSAEMTATMITQKRANKLGLFKFGFIPSPFVFQLITRNLSERMKSLAPVTVETFNPMWVDSDDL